ncbi:MAG: hypothetical protein HYX93_05140, partial [Chloroflexi bacterium]|nr:hypothetical protein [Chloroflexota bacterium]
PLEAVEGVNSIATGGLKPDLTIFLDLPPEEGMRRRSTARDRFERGSEQQDVMDFHRRVRQGYLDLARREPERWLVVDARQSPRQVARDIWKQVEPLLLSRQTPGAPHGSAGGEAPAGGLGVSPRFKFLPLPGQEGGQGDGRRGS